MSKPPTVLCLAWSSCRHSDWLHVLAGHLPTQASAPLRVCCRPPLAVHPCAGSASSVVASSPSQTSMASGGPAMPRSRRTTREGQRRVVLCAVCVRVPAATPDMPPAVQLHLWPRLDLAYIYNSLRGSRQTAASSDVYPGCLLTCCFRLCPAHTRPGARSMLQATRPSLSQTGARACAAVAAAGAAAGAASSPKSLPQRTPLLPRRACPVNASAAGV